MNHTKRIPAAPRAPSAPERIPFVSRSFGSWEIAINRRARAIGDLASQYDSASEGWARTANRFRLEAGYRKPLVASGAAEVLARAGSEARILDCGIGSGSLSIALDSIVPDQVAYHGIDTSRGMLIAADAEMRRAGMSVQLLKADILLIPHPDRSFDVVMAGHVLEHLPEPHLALAEMTRILKPGGLLFFCMTRRSVFGTFIQLHWRTWAVTEQQGVMWLKDCRLKGIGVQPIRLGAWAGRASIAFWARKPCEASERARSDHLGAHEVEAHEEHLP